MSALRGKPITNPPAGPYRTDAAPYPQRTSPGTRSRQVTINVNGQANTKVATKLGGFFKEVKLNLGRAMGFASQDA